MIVPIPEQPFQYYIFTTDERALNNGIRYSQVDMRLNEDLGDIIIKNKDKLNSALIYSRDYHYDFFGFKTLERAYLLKINNEIVERPQHMLMRVSVGIHKEDIDAAIETYNLMSEKWMTHATPTLFNTDSIFSSLFSIEVSSNSISNVT